MKKCVAKRKRMILPDTPWCSFFPYRQSLTTSSPKVINMKKSITHLIFCLSLAFLFPSPVKAQSIAQDLEQLSLDYQKLAGLKSILKQMYTGYEVLSKGYAAVKAVAQGNFTLQEGFIDGLFIVSPAVRAYPRIADIINDQAMLVDEYQSAWASFRQDRHFNPDEIGYMLTVYNRLIITSLKDLSDLAMIITDNKLRMSDAERLAAIDRIYAGGHGQLYFLRSFNDQNYRIAVQRASGANDQQSIKKLYSIH